VAEAAHYTLKAIVGVNINRPAQALGYLGRLHAAQVLVGGDARYGLYHVAGTGVTNRSGQARAALEISRRLGGPHATVRDIKTIAAGLRAPRPRHSALSSEKFENDFGWRMPDWEDGLETVVARLVEELSAATERTG